MIFMTDAPADPLKVVVPSVCWINENRLIANPTIISRDFDSDERKIWVTQVSGPPEERDWQMDMVHSLREIGYHVAITAG